MKILLFGSTGMLGRYVFDTLTRQYNVISINRDSYDVANDDWVKLNYLIETNLKENDIIVNCIGIIPQKYTDTYIGLYIKVNTFNSKKYS